MLSEYERVVGVAAGEGINTSTGERAIKWTYIQAVFFAATILTTIGKHQKSNVTILSLNDELFEIQTQTHYYLCIYPNYEIFTPHSNISEKISLVFWYIDRFLFY